MAWLQLELRYKAKLAMAEEAFRDVRHERDSYRLALMRILERFGTAQVALLIDQREALDAARRLFPTGKQS